MRARLRAEVEAPLGPDSTFSKRWDLMIVDEPRLGTTARLKDGASRRSRRNEARTPLDAFLDLAARRS